MLEKTYQPADIEARIRQDWEAAEAFKCGRPERAAAEPYCIVIPPPNVTGSLHMGHALNNTLQDVLCRFERMRGKDVLWQPGTDHAGIATQLVVSRQLAEKQIDYKSLGREEFLKRVWEWKAQSGGTIVNQLKRLGASCDWTRERFTMDEGLSRAVLKVFVDLHKQELIYRDKRLVNWDPEFQSAVSDLEVEPREHTGTFKWARDQKDKDGNPVPFNAAALNKVLDKDPSGHMYYINYPLKGVAYDADNPATFVRVGTTRPETMLGDTGVAIHPKNAKLGNLIGKTCVLPLVGREIPIVGDEYADPEKGTGAVKITPAHDFNDWEVGKRAKLAVINILDATAHLELCDNGAFLVGLVDDFYGHQVSRLRPDRSKMRATAIRLLREKSKAKLADLIEKLEGIDRFSARKQIVADLHAAGVLEKIEPNTHAVPHAQRGDAIVEPWLTDQWYVDAATLAKRALAAVRQGQTRFVPEKYANDYFRWLENIQPWCISRQLWWGHQIPAWYGPDGEVFVAPTPEEAQVAAAKRYGCSINIEYPVNMPEVERIASKISQRIDIRNRVAKVVVIERDADVLDTWFSSALWPFSTLGWPDKTRELERFYPTSCLVTGFDIIFFWVARMMMDGLHFMQDAKGQPLVPFRDVYIHGLVLDEKGQKMSKTKGNVMDPLELIDVYGADALRFTLAAMTAQGRNVRLSKQRVEGYRNFATKLWNASRFAEMNECVRQRDFDPAGVGQTINKWIAGETERVAAAVTSAITEYRFNEAAGSIYEFTWGLFCDWYLELIKPILNGDDEPAKAETRACVAWVLDQILKLLHPFMPFITEELWAHMVEHGEKRRNLLALSDWPKLDGLADPQADAEIGWMVRLISEVRSVRSEMNVPAGAKMPLVILGTDKTTRERAERHDETIKRLARLDEISFAKAAPKGAAMIVIGETSAALPLEGVIDMGAERRRLEKEIEKAGSDLAKMDAKLTNPQFMAKAKEEAVEEARARKDEVEAIIKRLKAALKRVEG